MLKEGQGFAKRRKKPLLMEKIGVQRMTFDLGISKERKSLGRQR
jgi:hypothetical protein